MPLWTAGEIDRPRTRVLMLDPSIVIGGSRSFFEEEMVKEQVRESPKGLTRWKHGVQLE